MNLKTAIAAVACMAVGAVIGISIILCLSDEPSVAYIQGSVSCVDQDVVGIWVNAANGHDGWAERKGTGSTQTFSYILSEGGEFELHVGCGGTPKDWGSNTPTERLQPMEENIHIVCPREGAVRVCRAAA